MQNKIKYCLVIFSFILIFYGIGIQSEENILYFNKTSTENNVQITNFTSNEVIETFNITSDDTSNIEVPSKDVDNIENTENIESDIINEKIDINTASKEELMSIKGIGAKTADNIISYRENTPFTNIEDIKNVKNIGEKNYIKIEPYIMVK